MPAHPLDLPSIPAHRRRRTIGRALAALAVAAIGAATLRSAAIPPLEAEETGHWCLVCGELGGADVVQNLLLFAPLGVGLALAGWSRRRVAAAACALSTTVELVQLAGFTGRFATLSDVVSNTTGAWLGAVAVTTWAWWLTPTRRVARALAAAAALLWLGVLAAGGWALDRAPSAGPEPPTVSPLPFTPDMGWFSGLVHEGRLGGFRVAHRGSGAVIIAARTGRDVEGAVTATGRDERPFAVPLLYVHGDDPREAELIIGEWYDAATVSVRLRAARLRLRQPSLRVAGVFPTSDGATTTTRELEAGFRDGVLRLRARTPAGTVARSLPLRPTLAWALLLPFVRADGPEAPAMTTLWLWTFTVPLGFWAAGAAPRSGLARAAAAGAVAVGLLALPWLSRAGGARWWEWLAALAGVAVGAAAERLVRRGAAGAG